MFHRNRNKFNATRVKKDGHSFASKGEASLYDLLLLREKAGQIKDIRHQHQITFIDTVVNWRVDYSFWSNELNETVYAEYKGMETPDFVVKKNLWRTHGHGLLELWYGNYKNPYLKETIRTKPLKG
jgi:hypothetical protein